MINNVFSVSFNDFISEADKKGNYTLKRGEVVQAQRLRHTKVRVECNVCKKISKDLTFAARYFVYKYVCKTCSCAGEKNPFFGKKHTDASKEKISNANTGGLARKGGKGNYDLWIEKYGKEEADKKQAIYLSKLSSIFSGANNPMYGRKMLEEWIEKSNIGRKKWRDSLTQEERLKISSNLSKSQKKLREQNPEKYKEWKKKAGIAAAKSPKKYKINKIEKIIEKQLLKRGLDFKYTVILDRKQFDFGNKTHRILLEVQGDYWHGNPKIYKELNSTQNRIVEADKLKLKFAQEHRFMLFYIWEQDIKCGNFSVLENIKEYMNEI